MNISKLLTIALTLLLFGCADDDDPINTLTQDDRNNDPEKPNTELILYAHQDTFTVPSTFSIDSSTYNYQCDSASLVVNGFSYQIRLAPGFYSTESNQIICTLPNLPDESFETYSISINFSSFYDDRQVIDNFTESFSNSQLIIDIGNAPVREYTNSNTFTELDIETSDFTPAVLDYTGAATGIAHILKEKFSYELNELEVVEGLFKYGDEASIQERNGFSLFDIKLFIESIDFYAAGFMATVKGDLDPSNGESSPLEPELPFLALFNINGYLAYYVVIDLSENHFTVIHPILGFMSIPTSEIENKNILYNEEFVVMLFSETEFPVEEI